MSSVLSSLVRDTMLGWHGSFVGKKRKLFMFVLNSLEGKEQNCIQ